MATVAVLGTGIMGAPMARNLARAGHDVRVWNRTAEKAAPLAHDGATIGDTTAKAVEGADVVLTMLTDARAVWDTMVEGGVVDALPDSTLWIQSSTIGVAATEQLVDLCAQRGVVFVDAPVLGSKKPAEDGQLIVLASGPADVRDRCEPVFAAVAARTIWAGEAGCGTRLKLVANSWILCTMENLAETFALARRLGLDPRRFLETIAGGGMDMPYAHLKGELMLTGEFPASFPLRHARKDAVLVLEAAGDLELPLVRATLGQFDRALELGHGDEDMSAVYCASGEAAAS
jgi:3-hydroxyisobutyrate dehydrogenase